VSDLFIVIMIFTNRHSVQDHPFLQRDESWKKQSAPGFPFAALPSPSVLS